LIAAIGERFPGSPALIVGIGDDAAVLRAADGRVVATTDMLIEGRHFRREWSAARDIGGKAAARNLADIAAMGARPTALLVSFAGPGDLEVAWVLELAEGIAEEAAAAGACVAGGDTSSADVVMLAITALGDLGGREPVTRRAARPGDVVAIAGTLGSAAAGLALLSAGLTSPGAGLEYLTRAHRRPEPPYDAGPQAAALGATSMIDISDGLIADVGHIAAGSGVRLEVESALITAEPVVRPGSLAQAAALLPGTDWLRWVLAGGDDHALVATFPPGTVLPERWAVIGQVTRGDGVLVDGRRWNEAGGWEHFRSRLRAVSDQILNVTRPAGQLLDITTLMPRHRLEGRPRHRAKRQGFWPERSVRLDATQVQADQGRAMTSATTFAMPAARRTRRSPRPEYGRIVRGAMLTPWFAVSVGIVIATSLTFATPHPALTFPPSQSGRCVDAGCASASPPPSAPRPAIKHEVRLPATQQRAANVSVRSAGVKLEYELLPRQDGRFMAVIIIVGRKALGKWSLKFALPGAQIESIMWARWQPEGSHGVLVSGSPLPWPRSGANEARIVVFGAGSPGWPTGCAFDGGSCRFLALSGGNQHDPSGWPHRRARWPVGDRPGSGTRHRLPGTRHRLPGS